MGGSSKIHWVSEVYRFLYTTNYIFDLKKYLTNFELLNSNKKAVNEDSVMQTLSTYVSLLSTSPKKKPFEISIRSKLPAASISRYLGTIQHIHTCNSINLDAGGDR
jgi:mevalonate kinase